MFRGPGLPITGTAIVRGHGRRSTPGSQRQKGMPMPLDGDMKDLGRRSKNPWVVNLEARLRSTPEPMATG